MTTQLSWCTESLTRDHCVKFTLDGEDWSRAIFSMTLEERRELQRATDESSPLSMRLAAYAVLVKRMEELKARFA